MGFRVLSVGLRGEISGSEIGMKAQGLGWSV